MSAKEHKGKDHGLDPRGMKIPWEKSSDMIWDELESRLDKPAPVRNLNRSYVAIAASLALLLSVGSFMRLYTKTISTRAAVHTTAVLPDNSSVEINAESSLSYHPYWWWAGRKVKLKGEAFFKVQKGSSFRVISERAFTEVLGTSFNIYSRGDRYQVACHTGSVRVSEKKKGTTIILEPNEQTSLLPDGHFSSGFFEAENGSLWTRGMVSFSATPLHQVLEELERQFNINISSSANLEQVYSGQFSMEQPLDNILSLICLPFGLQYEQLGENDYHIAP